MFCSYLQHRILFDIIDESLSGTSGEQLLKNLYEGLLTNQICCQECGSKKARMFFLGNLSEINEQLEPFQDVPVVVSGCDSLEESLHRYTAWEMLVNENQYAKL